MAYRDYLHCYTCGEKALYWEQWEYIGCAHCPGDYKNAERGVVEVYCPECTAIRNPRQPHPQDQSYPMRTVPGRYGGLLRFTRMGEEFLVTVDDELGGTAMQANIHVDPDDTMDLVGFLQQKENNG